VPSLLLLSACASPPSRSIPASPPPRTTSVLLPTPTVPVVPQPALETVFTNRSANDAAASCGAGDDVACLALWQEACERDIEEGCLRLGMALRDGRGMAKNLGAAATVFQRLCDRVSSGSPVLGEPPMAAQGCRMLGYMYKPSGGLPADELRAAGLLRKACDGGDPLGCVGLGDSYYRAKQIREATDLYKAACQGGLPVGCRMLAGVYADLKDFPSGIIAAEKSCPDVVRGCALLGYMLCETKRDPQRAVELLAQACSQGDEFACMRLGLSYGDATCTPRDQLRASEYYRLACDRREYAGCALLGFQYLHGQGVGRDDGKARTLLTLACEHSDRSAQTAISCSTAASLYASPQSGERAPALAARMYELSCEAGQAESCAALGGMYAQGDGVPKSAPRALQLLQPACTKKKMKQCQFVTPLRNLTATCSRGQFQQCVEWGLSP